MWQRALALSSSTTPSLFTLLFVVVIVLTAWFPTSAALVGKWTFNENGGTTAFDSSGVGGNGTINGGATRVAAPGALGANYALHFDGVDDFVQFPFDTGYDVSAEMTIEAWILVADSSPEALIFGQAVPRFGVSTDSSFPFFYVDNSPASSVGADIPGNSWGHLVCTYVDSPDPVARIYWNGSQIGARDFSPNNPDPADDNGTFTGFYVSGRGSISSPSFLQGDIDEIRYYNSALTTSEVLANFNAGPTLIPEPMISSLTVIVVATMALRPRSLAARISPVDKGIAHVD